MPDDGLIDQSISVARARQIDRLCDTFEREHRDGSSPDIEQYLNDVPKTEKAVVLRELVELDVHYRQKREDSRSITQDEYSSQFPDYKDQITTVFQASDGPKSTVLEANQSTEVSPALQPTVLYSSEPPTELSGPVVRKLREYELQEEIGRGGMGRVYKALHTKLDKVVALKVLSRECMHKPTAVARFERERRAVGRLDHPNIVRATDAGEVDGVHFLVMEFVAGADLDALLRRVGPLDIADACELMRQTAVGLQHAYEHGLVHRDIKPSNLMLCDSGTLKILDLGLARLRSGDLSGGELTQAGQVMGTFDYMAPEQAQQSHDADIRADIYSLGCTLYKLLTAHKPFGSQENLTPMGIVIAHAQEPFPAIQRRRPDVSDQLAAVLERMAAKSPQERPATPADVVTFLEPFCAGCDLPRLTVPGWRPKGPTTPEPLPSDDQPSDVPADRPGGASAEADKKQANTVVAVPQSRRRFWMIAGGVVLAASAGVLSLPFIGAREIDLLQRIDPQRDAVDGDWAVVDGALVSPKIPNACLRLPYNLSSEFTLEIEADRQEGLQMMFVNVSDETPCTIAVGAVPRKHAQTQPEASVLSSEDGSLFAGWGDLADPGPRRFLLTVRKTGVELKRDGEVIIDWSGQFESLRRHIPAFVPNRAGFYLCTDNSEYRFGTIKLHPRPSPGD